MFSSQISFQLSLISAMCLEKKYHCFTREMTNCNQDNYFLDYILNKKVEVILIINMAKLASNSHFYDSLDAFV